MYSPSPPHPPFDNLLLHARVYFYDFLAYDVPNQWQLDELIENDVGNLGILYERLYDPRQRRVGMVEPRRRGADLDARVMFAWRIGVWEGVGGCGGAREERRLAVAPRMERIPKLRLEWENCEIHAASLPCLACLDAGLDIAAQGMERKETTRSKPEGRVPRVDEQADELERGSDASSSLDDDAGQSWDKFDFGLLPLVCNDTSSAQVELAPSGSDPDYAVQLIRRRFSWEEELPPRPTCSNNGASIHSSQNSTELVRSNATSFTTSSKTRQSREDSATSKHGSSINGAATARHDSRLRDSWPTYHDNRPEPSVLQQCVSAGTQEDSSEVHVSQDVKDRDTDDFSIMPEPKRFFWMGRRYLTKNPPFCRRLFTRNALKQVRRPPRS